MSLNIHFEANGDEFPVYQTTTRQTREILDSEDKTSSYCHIFELVDPDHCQEFRAWVETMEKQGSKIVCYGS